MDQHDLFNKPNDQELTAHAIATQHALSKENAMLRLIVDVTHDETGVGWRQAVTFKDSQIRELTELMAYSCKYLNIDWTEPNGSSETT
jgi:hypothetical protein